MALRHAVLVVILGLGACATPGQVRRVETQVAVLQREHERRDSARANELSRIIAMQGRIIDSLAAVTTTLGLVKGELSGEFVEVRRQLLTVQTLQGQSQARLTELRAQLEARQDALETASNQDTLAVTSTPATGGSRGPTSPAGGGGVVPSADQIYQQSQAQLNRGSAATARAGFRELLRLHPLSPRVADAMFGIGQSFEGSQPDSALTYFRDVAQNFPESERAPQAMFKLGDAAQRAGDLVAAKQWFTRVAVDRYRGTSEHDLAVARLRQLP